MHSFIKGDGLMLSKTYDTVKPIFLAVIAVCFLLGILTNSYIYLLLIIYTTSVSFVFRAFIELEKRNKSLFFLYIIWGIIIAVVISLFIIPLI